MDEPTQALTMTVRTGLGTVFYQDMRRPRFHDEVATIRRKPRFHTGWQSITYKGKRYQLFGGVRTPFFICLNSEIKGRECSPIRGPGAA